MKLKQQNHLQDLEELKYFTNFISSRNISSYLEIGSYTGSTLYAAIANSPLGCIGVSIDISTDQCSTIDELNSLGYKVSNIRGNSRDLSVIEKAKELGPYDIVFIDASHTYDDVKSDWLNYGTLAPIVIFHDVYAPEGLNDVRKFWLELKENNQFQEIREFHTPNSSMGYGIVFRAV